MFRASPRSVRFMRSVSLKFFCRLRSTWLRFWARVTLRPTAQANGSPPHSAFTAKVLFTMKWTSEGLMSGHKDVPTNPAPVFAHVLTLISCVAFRYRPAVLKGAFGLLRIGRHESSVLPMKLLLNAASQYGSPLLVFWTGVTATPTW